MRDLPSAAEARNDWLDVCRALAIAMVLFSHGRHFIVPVFPWASEWRIGGYLGVELFFVLSGFLIGTMLLDYASRCATPWGWVPNFWARRWLRTLPAYYAFVVINLLLVLVGVHAALPDTLLPYLFFLQNLAWPHPAFFPEAWSLAVEELFYFVTPLLIGTAALALGRGERSVVAAMALLFTVSLAARINEVYAGDPLWDDGIRKVVLFRFDAIMVGVLLAWGLRCLRVTRGSAHVRRAGLIVAGTLLPLSVILALRTDGWLDNSAFARIWLFLVTDVGFAGLIAAGLSWRLGAVVMAAARPLARWSYSAYLANLSVLAVFLAVMGDARPSGPIVAIALWLMFQTATLTAAALSYRHIERPALRLRERRFSRFGVALS